MIETFILFLSIRGRINFLQLARYGKHKEQRYRQQFEKPFDFLTFNKELVFSSGSGRYAIAFDPGYISKAGKKTPGVGFYWSGCANQAKWGLERADLVSTLVKLSLMTSIRLTLHLYPKTKNPRYIPLRFIQKNSSVLLSCFMLLTATRKERFQGPLLPVVLSISIADLCLSLHT